MGGTPKKVSHFCFTKSCPITISLKVRKKDNYGLYAIYCIIIISARGGVGGWGGGVGFPRPPPTKLGIGSRMGITATPKYFFKIYQKLSSISVVRN